MKSYGRSNVYENERRKVVLCTTEENAKKFLDKGLKAPCHGSNLLVAGDFNVHNESWLGSSKTTLAGEYLEELSATHNLEQHVHCATRGKNPLDLILSDLGKSSRNAQPNWVLRPCGNPPGVMFKHSHAERGCTLAPSGGTARLTGVD